MSDLVPFLQDYFDLAQAHPDGPEIVGTYDWTFQFSLVDDEPFYLTVEGGKITVHDGDAGLDWQGDDWTRATCVRTSRQVLLDVVHGRMSLSEAFFQGELGYSPTRAMDRALDRTVEGSLVPWFHAFFRLAGEQAAAVGHERQLARLGQPTIPKLGFVQSQAAKARASE